MFDLKHGLETARRAARAEIPTWMLYSNQKAVSSGTFPWN